MPTQERGPTLWVLILKDPDGNMFQQASGEMSVICEYLQSARAHVHYGAEYKLRTMTNDEIDVFMKRRPMTSAELSRLLHGRMS